jgi:hypothetical protein
VKLTKSEEKIARIYRAIRGGGAVYIVDKQRGLRVSTKCKTCNGEYIAKTHFGEMRCPDCECGFQITYKDTYIAFSANYGYIDISWDLEEPVMFRGVKLDMVFMTEKGAKNKAKQLNK